MRGKSEIINGSACVVARCFWHSRTRRRTYCLVPTSRRTVRSLDGRSRRGTTYFESDLALFGGLTFFVDLAFFPNLAFFAGLTLLADSAIRHR